MPLTKQQLLIPRVLCIGGKDGEPNYPGSRFMTGDIIEKNGRDYWSVKADAWLNQTTVDKFPHLFKPLPWWERDESELPEYVKSIETGRVYKRIKSVKAYEGFEPADEADYQEYQKQKEA